MEMEVFSRTRRIPDLEVFSGIKGVVLNVHEGKDYFAGIQHEC